MVTAHASHCTRGVMEGGRRVYLVLVMFMAMVLKTRSHVGVEYWMQQWSGGDVEGEGELEWEEEEDEHDQFATWGAGRPPTGKNVVNVDSFGAVGDGAADDTRAFRDAWSTACSLNNAVFLVPENRHYKINTTRFNGPCHSKFLIQIQGKILAPEEPSEWDPKNQRLWLIFSGLSGARIQGGGVIDGSGSKWWAASCKINKTNPCKGAPAAVTIDSSSGLTVKNLRIQSAQQMHLIISRSSNVRVDGVHIKSPEDSPNTDGIHISESKAVTVQNCRIGTGDDCISIVNASFNIKMKNIECGPGHGISIGSLGKDNSTAAVSGIVLDKATITGTKNGLRIKTWQGGSGYVKGVRFDNVKMNNVENPIIIDQFYCESKTPCKNLTSAVKISQVMYRNISGTSRQAEAMRFACSDTVPCSNIVLANINLAREDGEAETVCNCAMGFDYGFVRPAADCLRNGACGGGGNQIDEPRHTEL